MIPGFLNPGKPTPSVHQAYVRRDRTGPRVVARSAGFQFEAEELALRWAVRFGNRPPGVRCTSAVFAVRTGEYSVVFGQVADLSADPADQDPPLGFRLLWLPRGNYTGDPFAIDRRFPPDWSARGEIADLEWPLEWTVEPPPRRAVGEIQTILKAGDGPLLLGSTQALLDGGRVAVRRPVPDGELVRGVWQLLPTRNRFELWPATFAFSAEFVSAGEVEIDFLVLPTPPPPGYLTEEQAKDYPQGRYELAVQTAAEAGDQAELDRLFARKTSQEVLRMAVAMVVFALLVAVVMKFL